MPSVSSDRNFHPPNKANAASSYFLDFRTGRSFWRTTGRQSQLSGVSEVGYGAIRQRPVYSATRLPSREGISQLTALIRYCLLACLRSSNLAREPKLISLNQLHQWGRTFGS